MRGGIILAALLFVGCRPTPLGFACVSDSQCGNGGVCASGACAFPTPLCPSGYSYDESAGALAGQCVAVGDMAAGPDGVDMAMVEISDMATALDMVVPDDLTITCGQVGQNCTVGVGACARTGTVMCASPGVPTCSATAGAPDNTGTWHQAAAANGSWDWDCDGSIEFQYPSGDTTPPPVDQPSITMCTAVGVQSVCEAAHWYYVYEHSFGLPSCGHPVDDMLCAWQSNGTTGGCIGSGSNEVTEGCR